MALDSTAAEHPSLTVVAIMRNEERNLPGLIENLRPWVPELILVDDRSTDSSAQMADEAGPFVTRILTKMNKVDGFSGLRNTGLNSAHGAWVMHMDCDERVPPDLASEIIETIPNTKLNGLRYRRLNYFLHRPMRYGGWSSWNRPQIARRGYHHFEGRLHETCIIKGGNASIGQLKHKMPHLNDEDFTKRLKKSAQYVKMESERLAEKGIVIKSSDIFWRAFLEFGKKYFYQQGFRDGTPGLIAAMHSATAVFRTYALLWDRQNRIPRSVLEEDIKRLWSESEPL